MSSIWQNNFNKLLQFKAEFGHTNVPKSYVDGKLARLVITLRQQKRYKTLKPERELALHQIGFDFEPQTTQWLSSYNKVVEFYRLNGHSSPNRRSKNDHERAIADWVHRMHKMIRNDELLEEQIQKLKLINIDGNPSNYKINSRGLPQSFDTMLERLNNYINQYSHTIHPTMADPALYEWVLLQHKRINASVISPKEYAAIMKTGFKLEQEFKGFLRDVNQG